MISDGVANGVANVDYASAAIIGAGQAGAALGHALRRIGIPVAGVASRSDDSARRLAADLHAATMSPAEALAAAELVIVATPDDVTEGAVRQWASRLGERGTELHGTTVVHTSGVLELAVLTPLGELGARVGVLHPVTPLVPPDDAATLAKKPIGCEISVPDGASATPETGDRSGGNWATALASALGGRPVALAGVQRPLYHAAASMSANLVVGMAGAASRAFVAAGADTDDAAALVGSLLQATAANVAEHGPEVALTGPARRGDAQVLASHMQALAAVDPELAETYRLVSRRILDLMPEGDALDRAHAALARPADTETGGNKGREGGT